MALEIVFALELLKLEYFFEVGPDDRAGVVQELVSNLILNELLEFRLVSARLVELSDPLLVFAEVDESGVN